MLPVQLNTATVSMSIKQHSNSVEKHCIQQEIDDLLDKYKPWLQEQHAALVCYGAMDNGSLQLCTAYF